MEQGGTGLSTSGAANTVLASNGTNWIRSSNFLTLNTVQTVTGAKNFQTIVVPTQPTTDNSTNAASTAFVKAQGYQSALGFTPVQQGGGTGQLTNKVYIGWDTVSLKAQVDATDLGRFAMQSGANSFTLSNVFSQSPTVSNQPTRSDNSQKLVTSNWVIDVLTNEQTYGLGSRSLGAVGYQKVGAGIMMMWGTSVVTTDGNGGASINFPLTLTTVYTVLPSNGDINAVRDTHVGVFSWNNSSFVILSSKRDGTTYSNAAIRINWMAFGS